MKTLIQIRIILACIIWIAFAKTAKGEWNYYVYVESDGEGYVYASENEIDYDKVPFGSYDRYGLWEEGEDDDCYEPEKGTPYWIYAKPEEGWEFKGWKRKKPGNGMGGTYGDEIYSTSNKLQVNFKDDGYFDSWKAVFKVKEIFSLSGVPGNFTVYINANGVDEKISPDANGVYNIPVNRKVTLFWGDDSYYYCSFNPEVDFNHIINGGVEFTMPWHDIVFSASYLGYMLSGVPDDVSVFVDNKKVSPDEANIYYILPDKPVKIEWTGDVKYTLDKDIKLTDVQEHSISFNMPKSSLKLISKGFVKLNEEENSTSAASHVGETRDVILMGRTLYHDGYWNTLCLPFSVDNLAGTPLEGFTVKELETSRENNGHKTGFDNGTLYLNFKDATSIKAGLPYIVGYIPDLVISSKDDWNDFVQSVNEGTSYEGKVVRLDADISISKMAGTKDRPFRGTFDGNGHSIKLNLYGGGEGLALFYLIDDATIQDLKVYGAVYSTNRRPATLASFVSGKCTIKNCWSSVDITSTRTSSWVDCGALVARVSAGATLNMQDCAFTGSIQYHGGTSGGSMVGFTQSSSAMDGELPDAEVNLTNCLFSPLVLSLAVNAYHPRIFVSGDVPGNLTNCYYNAVALASPLAKEGIDGSDMSNAALVTALGPCWEVKGKNALPKCSFVDPVFNAVTFKSATPTAIPSDDKAVSFKGNYDRVVIAKSGDKTKIYMDAENTIRYPEISFNINAFRAYFQLGKDMVFSSLGDVNGDRDVSLADVMMIVDNVLGNTDCNFIKENADLNGDHQVSLVDVMSVVDIILNGSNNVYNVIVNIGDNTVTYGDGGSGPARSKKKE